MINTIIFDIGNVLTDFRWRDYLKDLGFDDDICKRIGDAAMSSSAWNDFDAGKDEEEVLREFIANDPGIESQIRLMFKDIGGTLRMYDTSIPFLEALKEAGYRRLILSNLSQKTVRECSKDLKFLDHVDGGILSYRVGLIKPDSKIFSLLIRRYGLTPCECVFIDDREENVRTARELGMNGIVYSGLESALKELEKLGVSVAFDMSVSE
ncbi:MAG: HAD family phosphatase [Lachnospiraceae bacterium]|nr:HAD family phosphatase [Lachnospiraceae bacterium]